VLLCEQAPRAKPSASATADAIELRALFASMLPLLTTLRSPAKVPP
jgi:hypothetical protein